MAIADEEPSLESLLENEHFAGEGLQELFGDSRTEQISKQQAQQQFDQKMELAEAYQKTLDKQSGYAHMVMEDLLDRTLRQASWDPNRENPQQWGMQREGQNTVVNHIVKMIRMARTGEIRGMSRDEYVDKFG